MQELNLSRRLQTVAGFVPKGARLLDVGSDHAYLPIALVSQALIDFAIAGEVVSGPYQSARSNVKESGLSDQIDVRLADGLEAFELSDGIDTVSICGMGGLLITEILGRGQEKLPGLSRLILQPNNREDDLRRWLQENQFKIVAEATVQENQKFYEIMVAEPGQMQLTEKDLRFGPHLLKTKSSVFKEKWLREKAKLEKALTSIPEQHSDSRSSVLHKIRDIKEVLHESESGH